MNIKITPAAQAEIGRLIHEGVRQKEIARRFGVGHMTIWRHAQRIGAPSHHSRLIPPSAWPEVKRLAAAGSSLREIGLVFGASKNSAARLCRRLGVKTHGHRGPKPVPNENIERIRTMALAGLTYRAMASELSLSESQVWRLEQAAGLPPRNSPVRQRMEAAHAR